MAYLLDVNVFIQAKNLHYGFDFCPAFWDWLVAGKQAGRVLSIEKVGDEIAAGADELSNWAAGQKDLFMEPGADILPALGAVSAWRHRKITNRRRSIRFSRLPIIISSPMPRRRPMSW
jgi:hypothetical protein